MKAKCKICVKISKKIGSHRWDGGELETWQELWLKEGQDSRYCCDFTTLFLSKINASVERLGFTPGSHQFSKDIHKWLPWSDWLDWGWKDGSKKPLSSVWRCVQCCGVHAVPLWTPLLSVGSSLTHKDSRHNFYFFYFSVPFFFFFSVFCKSKSKSVDVVGYLLP